MCTSVHLYRARWTLDDECVPPLMLVTVGLSVIDKMPQGYQFSSYYASFCSKLLIRVCILVMSLSEAFHHNTQCFSVKNYFISSISHSHSTQNKSCLNLCHCEKGLQDISRVAFLCYSPQNGSLWWDCRDGEKISSSCNITIRTSS